MLATSLPRLVETLRTAPVIRLADYDYFVHPITDGFPSVDRDLLQEVTEGLARHIPARTDILLAPEAMGLPLGALLTQRTGVPFTVARKRKYGLPGEVVAPYNTGYSQGTYYLNGITPGARVAIIDDVVSRGGTLQALAKGVHTAGATLAGVAVVVDKSPDKPALEKALGVPVHALVRVQCTGGRVQVLP